jgi:hypothetical protein
MRIQMKNSEVLNVAADVLDGDGWYQGGYAPDQTVDGASMEGLPVCTMGAIYRAARTPLAWSEGLDCWIGVDTRVGDLAAEALAHYLGTSNIAAIPLWNDARDQTQAEVTAALRAAALIEQAKEQTPADAEAVVSA